MSRHDSRHNGDGNGDGGSSPYDVFEDRDSHYQKVIIVDSLLQ